MRVLLLPRIGEREDNAAYYLCQNFIDSLHNQGYECAISAPKDVGLKRATLYEAPIPSSSFFTFRKNAEAYKTYEAYLKTTNQSSYNYLKDDVQTVLQTLEQFQPDICIDLGRLSAPIACHIKGIPFYSYLSGAVYRNHTTKTKHLKDLNEVLSYYQTEQVLEVNDLYKYAHRIVTFGTLLTQPFPEEISVLRYGSMSPIQGNDTSDMTVGVYLTDTQEKQSKVKAIVDESFKTAPYDVNVLYHGATVSHDQNIHYTNAIKASDLLGNAICIHDGNDYLTNLCMMLGIPQIVVNDGSWLRSWNASSVSRNGLGLTIPEKDLSVQSLYETYRRIVTDSYYKTRAIAIKNDLLALTDITQFKII